MQTSARLGPAAQSGMEAPWLAASKPTTPRGSSSHWGSAPNRLAMLVARPYWGSKIQRQTAAAATGETMYGMKKAVR